MPNTGSRKTAKHLLFGNPEEETLKRFDKAETYLNCLPSEESKEVVYTLKFQKEADILSQKPFLKRFNADQNILTGIGKILFEEIPSPHYTTYIYKTNTGARAGFLYAQWVPQ